MFRGRGTSQGFRRGALSSTRGASTRGTTARSGARGPRGGGRGGRGRRGRGGRSKNAPVRQKSQDNQIDLTLDINQNSIKYFTSNATADQHFEAQNTNRDKYVATLIACDAYSIEITANAKARSLAAAFARHDNKLIDLLLNQHKQYGFVDILKAVTILDSAREIRAREKKIKRLELSGSKIKPHKLGKIKNDINNLKLLKPNFGSASGAVSKHIRRWIKKFTAEDFEFFALFMPTENWKKLANIVHFNSIKDFPQATWFLPYCFGAQRPKDSLVDKCRGMNDRNVNQYIANYDIPYSVLKKYVGKFTNQSKLKIAEKQDKLDTIIWYYEDLVCPAIDDIIKTRIEKGEKLTLPYGKLMERLLMFKDKAVGDENNNFPYIEEINGVEYVRIPETTVNPNNESKMSLFNAIIPFAEDELKKFISTIDSPCAVIGDASGSMSVAIRTATIISSLLTAICSAKLSFFNTVNFLPKIIPKSIAEVIEVAFETVADYATAPAASLVPYYDNKEIIKTFIIVTDEEENENAKTSDGQSWKFYDLFMKYRESVYPAALIFISFLDHQHDIGQMYKEFVDNKIPNVLQFKFDRARPDLTKLDSILGKLCSNSTTTFSNDVDRIESMIKENDIGTVFNSLNIKSQNNP